MVKYGTDCFVIRVPIHITGEKPEKYQYLSFFISEFETQKDKEFVFGGVTHKLTDDIQKSYFFETKEDAKLCKKLLRLKRSFCNIQIIEVKVTYAPDDNNRILCIVEKSNGIQGLPWEK